MFKKILISVLCVVLIAALLYGGSLYYRGLLSFVHPLSKADNGQIKVACVGDSVTYGFGIPNRANYNYPKRLAELLGDGYCVNNYGYSGRTLSLSGDRPLMNEKLYSQSLQFEPDVVVFMLGSNDSKPFNWNEDAFRKDFPGYLQPYRDLNPNVKIYVVVPTPVFPVNGAVKYNIDGEILQNEIVPLVRELGAEYGDEEIDMNSVFDGREDLFSDGCHPNRDGALLFAQSVYAAITKDTVTQ